MSAGRKRHVYFPTSGLISLVLCTKDSDLIEAGMVGREGAAGLQSAFGRQISFARAVVQIAGTFYTTPVEPLRRAIDQSEQARQVVYRYTEVLLAESQRLAACNAAHHGESRLARWLLQAADRTGTDRLALTQEFLGEMLALRRTRVTVLAQALQDRGIISYSRGKITLVDRAALQASACECYQLIQELYRALYSSLKLAF
jgi:CRP-like cAMP-binding protein